MPLLLHGHLQKERREERRGKEKRGKERREEHEGQEKEGIKRWSAGETLIVLSRRGRMSETGRESEGEGKAT